MSRTIDDKVVEMQFDNAQFERGVKETMSTLEKFKQALDMSVLGTSIEKVQVKFSAFDAMVKRIFEDIADSAWNTGKKLVKSLSVDNISVGWEKFGNKTEAVQTIMSATSQTWEDSANVLQRTNKLMERGYDEIMAKGIAKQYAEVSSGVKSISAAAKELGVTPEYFKKASKGLGEVTYAAENTGGQMAYVSEQLEKLNWFTDETSYSFMDMVNNIGKFTANNVPLDQAVTSMQGISTWAALSGANVNEAGRAMYNLSQAIAVGSVKLMDWKSIENANMATAEFKQIAIETAVELGTLKDKGDGAYETLKGNAVSVKNFNQALSDAWFSSDVLLKTLDKYGGFAEQMNSAAESTGLTAKMLLDYTHAMKDGTFDIEEALARVHESEDYAEVTADELKGIISGLADESNELGMRAFEAAQAAKTFKDVINYVKEAVGTGWMNTFELIFGNYEEAKKLWSDLAEEMYDIFVEAGDQRNEMLRAWKTMGGRDDLIEAFWNVFHTIKGIISAVKDAFHEIFPAMTAERLKSITERLRDLSKLIMVTDEETGELNERGEKIKTTFKGVFAVLRLLKDIAVAVIKPVKNLFAGVGGGFLDFSANLGDILLKYTDMVRESGALEEITRRLGGVFQALRDFIGNVFEIFRGVSYWEGGGGIAGVFESIFDGINNAVRLFFDVFSALTGKDLSAIRDKVMGTIRSVRDFIVDGLGPISGILEKVRDRIAAAIKAVKDSFGGFKKVDMSGAEQFQFKTAKIFNPLVSLFEGLRNIFTAVWEGVKKLTPIISAAVTAVGKLLAKIGSAIGDVFRNADPSNFLDIINSGALVAIGVGITKFVTKINEVAKSLGGIKDVFKSITGFLDGIKKSYTQDKQANMLLKIAGAVLILATSALILSSIDSADLTSAMTAISILIAELALAMDHISKLDSKKATKGSATLVGMAAAVLVLTGAVKKLSGLSWEEMAVGLVGVTVLLGEMVAAAKILSSGDSSKMMKGATNAVIFAAAIRVMVTSVKAIGSMNTEQLIQGMIGLTVLMAEMVIAAKILSGEKVTVAGVNGSGAGFGSKTPQSMMKGATNAVIFAAALRVLVTSVKALGTMNQDALIQGMVGVTILLTEMVVAAKVISSGENNTRMMKGAANAILFAAALRVLVSSVRILGDMDTDTLKQGLIGVTVLITEMAAAAKILSGSGSGSLALITAAGALVILGAAMKLISTLSWEDVAKGLVAFAGFIVVLAGATALIAPVIPYIMALAVAMGAFGLATAAFGIGLLAVSAALTAFSVAGEVAFASLLAGIRMLITAIPDLISALADSLARSVESLASLVISVGTALLESIKELVPKAVEIVLEVILSVLHSIGQNIAPIVEALLDIVIGTIEGLVVGVPKIISASIELIKEIIQVLLDAFGSFSLADIVEATALLVALDGMVVLVIGLAAEAVAATAMLPTIGKNLSNFGKEIDPFLRTISRYDVSSLQGAAALGELILSLTAADILDSLTSWITGGNAMEQFGKELVAFGPYLKEYSDSVKGINSIAVKRSAEAAKSLTDFAHSIPNTGGLVAKITGDNSLAAFAKELAEFGPSFRDYADAVKNVKPNVIKATSTAAETITAMANGVPKRGGLVSLITGENSLSAFAEELSAFGPAFAMYAGYMKNVDAKTVAVSSAAAETITAFADGVPKRGGLVSLITGENSLSDFAEELKAFGDPFVEYANKMAGISNLDAIEASSSAATFIAQFASIIPPSGGIVQLVTGKNDLAAFGEALKAFGPGLKDYVASVQDLKFDNVKTSAEAVGIMAKVASELPETGGVAQWFTGEASLSKLGDELKLFAPGFSSYVKAMNGVGSLNNVVKSSLALTLIAGAVEKLPKTDGIAQWFTGDVSLAKFGEELAAFGPSFAQYTREVSDVTADKIMGSSEGLKLIAEAAAALPTEGGIEKWFTGTTSLSNFGKQLEKFGPQFAGYVVAVTEEGMSYEKLGLATAAISSLVDIAIALGKTGGMEQWWSGEYSLEDFGDGLAIFGERFRKYGDDMANTDITAIETSISAISDVFNILPEDYQGTEPLTDLGDALVKFGDTIMVFAQKMVYLQTELPGYKNVFSDVFDDIQDVVEQLTGTDISALNKYADALGQVAENMYTKFSSVFTSHIVDVNVLSSGLLDAFLDQALRKLPDYNKAGIDLGKGFKAGFDAENISSYVSQKLKDCVTLIRSYYSSFKNAGEYLSEGFTNGMSGKTDTVRSTADKVGSTAVKALNKSIQAQSPSKLSFESGTYFIMGFSNALLAGISNIRATANAVGSSAVDELSNSIASMAEVAAEEIDTVPIIRPVLDLSGVYAGSRDLDAMFSRRQAFSIGTDDNFDTPGGLNGGRGFIQFNQYNYSPKALSSIDIYRQTNNQLSRYK